MITERRKNRMKSVLEKRQPDLTVVFENIHDRHNVSAIFRSCDAIGIQELQLLYYIESFPKIGKKSSSSAKKWIDINQFSSPADMGESLKKRGFTLYATHLAEKAVSIYDVDWCKPSALIVGNEHRGISDETLEIADENVYIPMFGMIQSLNVSVATAVTLYEICRQRLAGGFYEQSTYGSEELETWLKNWMER